MGPNEVVMYKGRTYKDDKEVQGFMVKLLNSFFIASGSDLVLYNMDKSCWHEVVETSIEVVGTV